MRYVQVLEYIIGCGTSKLSGSAGTVRVLLLGYTDLNHKVTDSPYGAYPTPHTIHYLWLERNTQGTLHVRKNNMTPP